jgi:ribosomal protein S27AE
MRDPLSNEDRVQNPGACPKCGFEGHDDWALYCERCGEEIQPQNFCMNKGCVKNLDEPVECPLEARYCPECGRPTLFAAEGRFSDFDPESDDDH